VYLAEVHLAIALYSTDSVLTYAKSFFQGEDRQLKAMYSKECAFCCDSVAKYPKYACAYAHTHTSSPARAAANPSQSK
jgi:hypothetical protein